MQGNTDFPVRSHCFTSGHYEISAKEAAPIMGVTVKTAKNYLGGKTKTDPVRLAYLQAVVGKKIIPEQAPVWWCSRKKMLFCDSGWGMGAAQLGNMFYLAELRDRSIDYMKVQTKALRAEIEALNNEVKALKLEAAPKPAALPSNIIEFKLRSKR